MNPWIQHVKAFASKKGINYRDALKHPDVKKGYKPKPKMKGGATEEEDIDPRFYTEGDEEYVAPRRFVKGKVPTLPSEGFTMGSTPFSAPPTGRRIVKGKVPVRPSIPTMEINSIQEFERFLKDNNDVIRQVLKANFNKRTFVSNFHPDKCITSSKAVEDLLMQAVEKKVVVNAPHIRVCEAIFKKFSFLF
jgi:hypothetical protein